MNKQTLERMQQMKLYGMHSSFSGVLNVVLPIFRTNIAKV